MMMVLVKTQEHEVTDKIFIPMDTCIVADVSAAAINYKVNQSNIGTWLSIRVFY
jgi:hypothetical protein